MALSGADLTPAYTGATVTIDKTTLGAFDFVDEVSLVKWVDARTTNGCDGLAGSPHVRSTAHVLTTGGSCAASGGATADRLDACASKTGQGIKACRQALCVYTVRPLHLRSRHRIGIPSRHPVAAISRHHAHTPNP